MLPFILLLSGCEFFGQQEYSYENTCRFEKEDMNVLINNDDALGSDKKISYYRFLTIRICNKCCKFKEY